MVATPTTIDRTNYNALVDDDGTNTIGTIWSKNQEKIVNLDPIDAMFNGASPFYFGGAFGVGTYYPTTTGTQNDWDIDTANGFTVGHLYCNNATLLTINGIKAPTGNRFLWVTSIGAGQVDIPNQAAGSTAANRIINQVTGTISLAPGSGRALLAYDLTTARWRTIFHEQGAFIAVPYAAGDFTASAGTWTLPSGATNVQRHAYKLEGRKMTEYLEVTGSTVSNNGVRLITAIPVALTAAGRAMCNNMYKDGAAAYAMGASWISAAAQATINHYGATFNNAFNISTATTELYVTLAYEVQ